MGRRPNSLVVEYFERGAKLDDSSNRYEHTCRRCGEVFPKGRVDSLYRHLVRHCPNVGPEDRQFVLQQIERPSEYQRANKQPTQAVNGLPEHPRQEETQPGIALPTFSQHSALETLAEVSSSQLGIDGQALHQSGKSLSEVIAEQTLIARLQEETGLGAAVTSAETSNSYLYATDTPQPVPYTDGLSHGATNNLSASPLIQAASAANQQLEQAQARDIEQGQGAVQVDPELNNMGGQIRDSRSGAAAEDHQHTDDTVMSWNPTNVSVGQQTFGAMPLPSNGVPPGFGLLQKAGQAKSRGRFNDERRKEVSEIRKQGACLRCRMLKKSCSGETPCSTCRNVETARVWKGTCLRTRLADAFTLWSSKLFHSRARLSVSAAVHGLEPSPLTDRIEARFFASSGSSMSFAARSYTGMSAGVDPTLEESEQESKMIIVLDEGDNISDRLEKYANQVADGCIAEETSNFLRATLQKAQNLAQAEISDQLAKANGSQDQPSPRACYSHQNHLLKNVIELWTLTRILASPEKSALQLRHDHGETHRPQSDAQTWSVDQDTDVNESDQEPAQPSLSHRLILAQLLAVAESRCSRLSKVVMNELERRLLQRQQVSRFNTLLAAIMLLNCIERMSGLYRKFDTGVQSPTNTFDGETPVEGAIRLPSMETTWGDMSYRIADDPTFWSLDTPPSRLWPQGPQFAELLTMLLRIRGLPPQTNKTQDGKLAVTQDFGLPVHINGRPLREQADDQSKAPTEWLDPLQLNVDELLEQRDGQVPGKDDSVESWDMRFIAKVLLPERM